MGRTSPAAAAGEAGLGRPLYWGLSGFYLTHFMVAGALFPYLGLYLLARDFPASAVGELFAAATLVKLFAPYFWSALGDRSGRRLRIIRLTMLAAVGCFSTLALEPGYWWLLLLFGLYSVFWNGVLPQFEALTLAHLGSQAARYTRVRLWGSIGYIVSVAGLGAYFEHADVRTLPLLVLGLMVLGLLVTWMVPDRAPRAEPGVESASGVWSRLGSGAVLGFLASCLLMQASHGAYYAYYSVYLLEHGYRPTLIGLLWALGVVSEIVLFFWMHRVLERYSIRRLVVGCFGLTALRWALLALFPGSLALLLLAQLLHAVSYGAFHACSMVLVNRYFPGALRGRGQAIYASVSFGAGGALGGLASSQLWSSVGGSGAFLFSFGLSIVAGLIAYRWVR